MIRTTKTKNADSKSQKYALVGTEAILYIYVRASPNYFTTDSPTAMPVSKDPRVHVAPEQ